MRLNYNTNLIKVRRSYSPKEIADLFKVDKKTCLRWIKDKGLKVIKENTNPLLISGRDLKDFTIRNRKNRKTKLKENEYFCLKCQKSVIAKIGSEQIIKTGKTIGEHKLPQMNKIGLCMICETKLNKFLGVCQKD